MWEKTFQGLKCFFLVLFISCRSCSAFLVSRLAESMLRFFVASRSSEVWKTVMEEYMSLPGQGLHFWVGDQKVSAGTLVRACTAGCLVVVSAETDQQAHMIALGAFGITAVRTMTAVWACALRMSPAVPRWARRLSWGRAAVFQNWTQELIKKKGVLTKRVRRLRSDKEKKHKNGGKKTKTSELIAAPNARCLDRAGKHQVFSAEPPGDAVRPSILEDFSPPKKRR